MAKKIGAKIVAVATNIAVLSASPGYSQDNLATYSYGLSSREDLKHLDEISPITSRTAFNNHIAEFNTIGNLSFGISSGNIRNKTFSPTGYLKVSSHIREGVVNGRFQRNQKAWYLHLGQMIDRSQHVVDQRAQVDLIGFKLQMSVTGDCIGTAPDSGSYCTYTPSISTDPGMVHRELLIPVEFNIGSAAGEEISEATHLAIQADGWQRGEDSVGIDLDIINAGNVPSNNPLRQDQIYKRDNYRLRFVPSILKIDQNVYSNSSHSSIDRTTRGIVLVNPDEWNKKSAAMQAISWLLPGIRANLPANGSPNLTISNNLFHAANNQWMPKDSYTTFQTGRGYVEHQNRHSDNRPPAASWYNGFWMGYSPVRTTSYSTSTKLVQSGPRITTHGPFFSQGQIGTDLNIPQSGITLIDDAADIITQINFSNIDNLFVQSGLEMTRQAAVAHIRSTEINSYKLTPHVAFSGNRTANRSVFRYYLGRIFGESRNSYAGGDYTSVSKSGIAFSAKAIKYDNPDRDYYSFAEAKISKMFNLQSNSRYGFGLFARKAFDRPSISTGWSEDPRQDTFLEVSTRYENGRTLAYDLAYRRSKSEGVAGRATTIGMSYQPNETFRFFGQFTPSSSERSYIRGAAGFQLALTSTQSAPTLNVNVSDIVHRYSTSRSGNPLKVSEKIFSASINVRF